MHNLQCPFRLKINKSIKMSNFTHTKKSNLAGKMSRFTCSMHGDKRKDTCMGEDWLAQVMDGRIDHRDTVVRRRQKNPQALEAFRTMMSHTRIHTDVVTHTHTHTHSYGDTDRSACGVSSQGMRWQCLADTVLTEQCPRVTIAFCTSSSSKSTDLKNLSGRCVCSYHLMLDL